MSTASSGSSSRSSTCRGEGIMSLIPLGWGSLSYRVIPVKLQSFSALQGFEWTLCDGKRHGLPHAAVDHVSVVDVDGVSAASVSRRFSRKRRPELQLRHKAGSEDSAYGRTDARSEDPAYRCRRGS